MIQKISEFGGRIGFREIFGGTDEFAQIFQPSGVFDCGTFVDRIKHFNVARLVKHNFNQLFERRRFRQLREHDDHRREVLYFLAELRCQRRHLCKPISVADDFHNRQARFGGEFAQAIEIRLTESALGHVDDSRQMNVVAQIVNDVQVRENVFDFLAFVKAQSADNHVRNFFADKSLFKQARLRIRAVQKRDVFVHEILSSDESLNF